MKGKLFAVVLLICLLTIALVGCTGTVEIKNGGFEEFAIEDDATSHVGWSRYYKDSSLSSTISFGQMDPSADQSDIVQGKYLKMKVSANNVVQLRQTVRLEKGKNYKMSYSIYVPENLKGNSNFVGAYVGFAEDEEFVEEAASKAMTSWEQRYYYFNVKESRDYTLTVGIGADGKEASGEAYFDNISIEEAANLPADIIPGTVSAARNVGNSDEIAYVVLLLIAGIGIAFFGYILMRKYMGANDIEPAEQLTGKKKIFLSPIAIFSYIMLAAFAIRFLIGALVGGMASEMTELGNVAKTIAKKGVGGLYQASSTTQPIGVLYILAAAGGIADLANLAANSFGMSLLLRTPLILADIISAYLIFLLVSKYRNQKQAFVAAGVFALLPLAFTASAAWGIYSAIPLAFILGMAYFMISKNYIGANISYTFALLFSNYMLILCPLIVLFDVYYFVKDASLKARLSIPLTAIAGFIFIYLISLPFTINYEANGDIFFVFRKMLADFDTNVLVSNNVFNLYAIFALGRAGVSTATSAITGILMLGFIAIGAWAFLKSERHRMDFVLLAALSFILYSMFGVGVKPEMTVIGAILLLVYGYIREEKRITYLANAYTFLVMLNIGAIMINSDMFASGSILTPFLATDWLYILGSILTLGTVVYICKAAYDILVRNVVVDYVEIDSVRGYFTTYYKQIKKAIDAAKN